jgi:hypothetical protein
MRNLKRNKRPIYLCEKYQDNAIDKFKEPVKLYENYVPTNSEGDLISIGMEYPMYLRIKTNTNEKNIFHAKDRLYIYKEPPIEHDALCKEADYEVYKRPMLYLNEMEIMLKRLSGDDDE